MHTFIPKFIADYYLCVHAESVISYVDLNVKIIISIDHMKSRGCALNLETGVVTSFSYSHQCRVTHDRNISL